LQEFAEVHTQARNLNVASPLRYEPMSIELLDAAARAQIALAVLVGFAGIIVCVWTRDNQFEGISVGWPLVASVVCIALFGLSFPLREKFDVVFWGLICDLALVAVLVWRTGGSEVSCYAPLYLMLPTFGVVVDEPPPSILTLYGVAFGLYVVTMFVNDSSRLVFEKVGNRIAVIVVTLVCFILMRYLDSTSKAAVEQLKEKSRAEVAELETKVEQARSEYALAKTFDEFETEMSNASSYEEREKILDAARGKRITWKLRFQSWVDGDGKDVEQPKGGYRFRFERPYRGGLYRVGYVNFSLRHRYPNKIRPDDLILIDGILGGGTEYTVDIYPTSWEMLRE